MPSSNSCLSQLKPSQKPPRFFTLTVDDPTHLGFLPSRYPLPLISGMSTTAPLYEQPPPTPVTAQAYTSNGGGGSVGAVIAVLAVITVLGVIAGMIGRLCSGRPIMGHGQYDFEGWIERKCSACLDGRVDPTPPRPAVAAAVSGGPEEAAQEEAAEEIKEEEEEEEEEEEPQLQRRTHGAGTS